MVGFLFAGLRGGGGLETSIFRSAEFLEMSGDSEGGSGREMRELPKPMTDATQAQRSRGEPVGSGGISPVSLMRAAKSRKFVSESMVHILPHSQM